MIERYGSFFEWLIAPDGGYVSVITNISTTTKHATLDEISCAHSTAESDPGKWWLCYTVFSIKVADYSISKNCK